MVSVLPLMACVCAMRTISALPAMCSVPPTPHAAITECALAKGCVFATMAFMERIVQWNVEQSPPVPGMASAPRVAPSVCVTTTIMATIAACFVSLPLRVRGMGLATPKGSANVPRTTMDQTVPPFALQRRPAPDMGRVLPVDSAFVMLDTLETSAAWNARRLPAMIMALALRRGSASVMQRTLGPSVEYFVTLRRLAMAMESVPAVVPVCVTPITLGLIVGPFASPIPLAAGLACARRVGHPACARTDTLAVIVPSFARQSPPALGMDSALLALEPVSVPRGIMGRIVPFSALTS